MDKCSPRTKEGSKTRRGASVFPCGMWTHLAETELLSDSHRRDTDARTEDSWLYLPQTPGLVQAEDKTLGGTQKTNPGQNI